MLRKIIPYILIIITLVGLFSPMIKVNAQYYGNQQQIDRAAEAAKALGRCNLIPDGNGAAIYKGQTTYSACRALKVRGYTIAWYPIAKPNTAAPTTNGENCSDHEFTTKEECEGQGHTWTENIASTPPLTGYKLLTPLPCPPGATGCTTDAKGNLVLTTYDPATGIGSYLNLMIKIFIGLCAVLCVIMIVMGGIEYMTSELGHTKEAGKERITHAILGLLIALGAYALLNTINSNLLIVEPKIPDGRVAILDKSTGTCSDPRFKTAEECYDRDEEWTPVVPPSGPCTVKSATFTPSGEQANDWYNEKIRKDVTVNIFTNNCQGKTIEMSITEEDSFGGDDDLPHSGLDNRPITVPANNHIVMNLRAGEEACEAGPGFDCNYYITIYKLEGNDYESMNASGGNLRYECYWACLDNWAWAPAR